MQPWHSSIKRISLYLERDISGVGLGPCLLQVRDGIQFPRNEAPANAELQPIVFASESLRGAETCYSKIEWEVLGILHGLEKFDHYYFACDVSVITDHRLLIAIFKNEVANISNWFWRILLTFTALEYYIRQGHKCSL